jgi:hypothetical protein
LLPDAKSESHGSIPTQIELDQTKKKEILDAEELIMKNKR